MPMLNPLGKLIRERMDTLGVSVRDLSKKTGISGAAIQRLMHDDFTQREPPRVGTISAVAAALQLPERLLRERLAVAMDIAPQEVADDQLQIIVTQVSRLDKADRAAVLRMVDALLERERYAQETPE